MSDLLIQARAFLAGAIPFSKTEAAIKLQEYLSIIEPIVTERVQLHKELLQAREKLRVPKDKELTDFDRRTMNEAYCAEVQEKYEMMKGMEELLKEKMELVKMIGSL